MASDFDLAIEDHKYRLTDGRIAVSVTAVCDGFVDDGKAAAFAGAAAKLTRERKNYRKEWDAKAERGRSIHRHLENWMMGLPVRAAPNELAYLDHAARFFEDHEVSPVIAEPILLSDIFGYGGRGDLFCTMDGDDLWLLDWKTGRSYDMPHTLQLNAYARADGIAKYDDHGRLVGLEKFDLPDRLGNVYITPEGATLVERPLDPKAFAVFCDLLDARTSYMELKASLKERERDARRAQRSG